MDAKIEVDRVAHEAAGGGEKHDRGPGTGARCGLRG